MVEPPLQENRVEQLVRLLRGDRHRAFLAALDQPGVYSWFSTALEELQRLGSPS